MSEFSLHAMTTVLLAHGAGGGIQANYAGLIEDLSADHTVIGLDLPGTGGSPRRAEPLTLDGLADELVTAADGHEHFTVVGYSLGTALAIRADLARIAVPTWSSRRRRTTWSRRTTTGRLPRASSRRRTPSSPRGTSRSWRLRRSGSR